MGSLDRNLVKTWSESLRLVESKRESEREREKEKKVADSCFNHYQLNLTLDICSNIIWVGACVFVGDSVRAQVDPKIESSGKTNLFVPVYFTQLV